MHSLIRKTQRSTIARLVPVASLALLPLLLFGCPGGGEVVKIGAVLPLTGDSAIYGLSIQKGMDLAIEEIALDTELGYSLEVETVDSGGDPATAASQTETLLASSVAVIGGVTSDEALAIAPVAEKADKVVLSPSASSNQLSGLATGKLYRLFPNSDSEAAAMATFLRDKLKLETAAILHENSSFGEGGLSAIQTVLGDGNVSGVYSFDPGNAEQLAAAVAEAMAAEDKTMYVIAVGQDLAAAMRALREAGWDGDGYRILTTSALASPAVLEAAGEAAYNSYFTQTAVDMSSQEEPVKGFVERFTAKYGEAPDLYAAYGYDSAQVVAQAIREGGTGGTLFASDFQKGMRGVSGMQGITGVIQFREDGSAQKFVRIYYVTNEGKLVDFDAWYKERQEEVRKRLDELTKQKERLLRDQSN